MDEQKLQDMINEGDRFGVASYFVDKFFIDFIDGMNEQSVDDAFTSIGLDRTYIENTCCLLYTSPSPRDNRQCRMTSSG